MRKLATLTLSILVYLVITAVSLSPVQAESTNPVPPKATLKVLIDIDDPNIFWNYTFLTKNAVLGKPSTVQIVWGLGLMSKNEKTETVVTNGKTSGQIAITADKGDLVNIRVAVRDSKGITLGFSDIQVRNNGQTERFIMAPPEYTEPQINWSNL